MREGRYHEPLKGTWASSGSGTKRRSWPARPTIAERKPSPQEEILLNPAPASGAIPVGQWKLVINGSRGTADAQALPGKRRARRQRGDELVELFHLAEDPHEKTNLASRHPHKVQGLRARYEALARQAVAPKTRPKPPGLGTPVMFPAAS